MARKVFVLVGPKVRLDRDGLSTPAPGSAAGLLGLCGDWAREVGWELSMDPRSADALVIGPGVAAPPLDVPVAVVRQAQGIDGFRWALRHIAYTTEWPAEVVRYGSGPEQLADLRRPTGAGPHPTAVLLHGGFWGDSWRRDLMDGLAVDLARRGWLTWNVEYRRIGAGGGWPASGNDVLAAADFLTRVKDAQPDALVLVGHSAGAQLALWAAGERRERAARVVALAGLCDLASARRLEVGGPAVERLLQGEPAAAASPIDRLPLGVPTLLAHAPGDPVVPVSQSRRYAEAAAAAGDAVSLVELPGEDHFALIDPESEAWRQVVARLA